MDEMINNNTPNSSRSLEVRYSGRGAQVGIYFRKFLRMFLYQSDWKVLPMSALIAGLVGMVMQVSMFVTMEGTLMGSFAIVMVCIWNGCFNSIQVICRERDVIKREHRSGMHISSYILAHMLYQGMLCLLQTIITLAMTEWIGLQYELCTPLFTHFSIIDYGVSLFLITYASDMMALWISSLVHNTTTAMTVMPFVLIFQLVFSGGMLTLPEWSTPLTSLTISGPGMNVLAAQGDINNRPLVSLWNGVQSMGNVELNGTFSLQQALDFLNSDVSFAKDIREREVSVEFTVGQALDFLSDDSDPQARELRALTIDGAIIADLLPSLLADANQAQVPAEEEQPSGALSVLGKLTGLLQNSNLLSVPIANALPDYVTLGELVDKANELGALEPYRDEEVKITRTVGEIMKIIEEESTPEMLQESIPIKTTIAEVQSILGVETVRQLLQETAAAGRIDPNYDHTMRNILVYWLRLLLFILVFSGMAVVALEFIDRDRR